MKKKKTFSKSKKQVKYSEIKLNIALSLISIIFGAIIGIAISNYYFHKNINYEEFQEFQGKEQNRPNISIEVFNKDYMALVIKTPNNREIIEKLRIDFVVDGLVTSMSPRGNIINGEPCILEKKPFFSFNDQTIYEKVNVKCDDILPSALNGIVLTYKKNHVIDFDENINVEFYWNYKGQTQIENFKIARG